jgi:malonyl-CoA O-methyltransferase
MRKTLPLVLLHGWGFDSRIWAGILPELEQSFAVITIDLPGFGHNHFTSADIREVAQNIIGLLPQKSILLGWSLGGMVATYIAIHYPQRVAALITVGSNLKWVSDGQWPGATADNFATFFENLTQNFETTKQHFSSVIARGDMNEKQLVKILRKKLSDKPKENFLQGLELLANIDNRVGFTTLTMPGLHLFGENDAMVPLAVEKTIRLLNQKQQTKIFSGLAHAPFLLEPGWFVSTIRHFIENLSYRLEKKRIAQSFSKAAATYDGAAQLQRETGDRLFIMLPQHSVKTVLDLGCGTGAYSLRLQQQFPQAKVIRLDLAMGMLQLAGKKDNRMLSVCADAEYLPFKKNSVDVVFSNLAIQWCQDYQQLFAELYHVLAPGGYCVISTFQDGTLKELKMAWNAVDDLTHVNYFAYAESLREYAVNAGFCSIDIQQQGLVQYYASVKALTSELRAIGAHNINPGRSEGLTGKQKLKKMLEAYESFRCDDKLPASYEIVFLVLKKE